jgi:Delta24-sterol reductase
MVAQSKSVGAALPAVPWWFDVLAMLRTPLIWWIVIPLSFIVDTIAAVRNWWFFTFGQAPKRHPERVRAVQQAVRAWHNAGRRKKLCTSRSAAAGMNTRMPDFKDACNKIDVSSLRDVLNINEQEMTITLEPMCNMGYVSRFLVPRRLALQCLPEMDDLTIGGLVNGYGVSTQSHKYGTMQDAIVSFDMVLSDGELVSARSDNEHADLFYAVPWAHGSLGILVSVTVKLVRIAPYVRMRYIPCYSISELERTVGALARGGGNGSPRGSRIPDYLEATLFSPTTSVIQVGDCCERSDYPHLAVNAICQWHKPWFYKHVEATLAGGGDAKEELIPIRDYYHRHTKSIYWELEDMIPFGNAPWFRWLFGWMGAPKVSIVKATQGVAVRRATLYKHVCQEFMVPLAKLGELHSLYNAEFNTYPLLLYIIRVYDYKKTPDLGQGFIAAPRSRDREPDQDYALFAELGAYGVPSAVRRGGYWDAISATRRLEQYARDQNGYQCLCFDTLQSQQDFEKMFDHRLWREVRRRYNCDDAFPTVLAKVRPEKGVVPE